MALKRSRPPRRAEVPVAAVLAANATLREFDLAFGLAGFTAKPNAKAVSGKRTTSLRVVWKRKSGALAETIAITVSGARA
jgi:hypothetical protein